MFFIKNYAENEAGRLVPDLFLFYKLDLYKVKANDLQFIVSFEHTSHLVLVFLLLTLST